MACQITVNLRYKEKLKEKYLNGLFSSNKSNKGKNMNLQESSSIPSKKWKLSYKMELFYIKNGWTGEANLTYKGSGF